VVQTQISQNKDVGKEQREKREICYQEKERLEKNLSLDVQVSSLGCSRSMGGQEVA
jgi:hypothetical protein